MGTERGKSLVSPFVWTNETHYGRTEVKENQRMHHKMVFDSSRSRVDCRLDGSKYIGRSAYQRSTDRDGTHPRQSVQSGAWGMKAFRTKNPELWRPQPDEVNQRKIGDQQFSAMIEESKPRVVTQLPEHILEYRIHRLKHPNFVPKDHVIAQELVAMESHKTLVQRAPSRVETWVDPWCEKWVEERKNYKYTKSGCLKKEKKEYKRPKRSPSRQQQAEQGITIEVPDRELLPAKRSPSKRLMRPQSVPPASRSTGSSTANARSSTPGHTSHADLQTMMSNLRSNLEQGKDAS